VAIMKSFERPQSEAPTEKSIEEQTRHEELDGILLLERVQNPVIRKQIIDLREMGENARKGEEVTYVMRCKDGKPQRQKDGRYITEKKGYVPKNREEIEADFDKRLDGIQSQTRISFDDKQPRSSAISLNWKWPETAQKPNTKQMAIIEGHEKGHVMRPYHGKQLRELFGTAFDQSVVEYTMDDYFRYHTKKERALMGYEDAKKFFYQYLFSATELAERMSQLKSYFGMRGNEQFTKEHLEYAREHYVDDTGMGNIMTFFFKAITPEKEEAFLKLINSAGI